MAANKILVILALAGSLAVSPAAGQTTGTTVRHHRVPAKDPYITPAVVAAENALEKKDYATAELKLKEAVAANDKNYRAWFDLGFLYNATSRNPEAIEAYRKSVAAKPDLFESRLNLGILLAQAGNAEAESVLHAATQLKPGAKPEEGLERAWLSLGHVLEARNPPEAWAAYREAAKLQPNDPEPHLAAGILLEKHNQFVDAEREYLEARRLDPKAVEPVAGLVNVYTRSKRLPEAEKMLRRYLELNPQNAVAHLQLARLLVAQKHVEDAKVEYEAALKMAPDPQVERELADIYFSAGDYHEATARYRALAASNPADPDLHYALGNALMHAHQYSEAQQVLQETVQLKPDMVQAYGDLAVAAAENKNYAVAIRALDLRLKYAAETPATYFLRATSYDNLRNYKQAVANYRQFLLVAGGKYPQQEWQARHRLAAIDKGTD